MAALGVASDAGRGAEERSDVTTSRRPRATATEHAMIIRCRACLMSFQRIAHNWASPPGFTPCTVPLHPWLLRSRGHACEEPRTGNLVRLKRAPPCSYYLGKNIGIPLANVKVEAGKSRRHALQRV